eukprot:CAMPEP_0119482732 /NCGR_PEP_ID=MMETSP1344-20130328/10459_1 /TAXON_ID=236787 /ORGANISM="Florenciella parvula, Strain CCMP2471" /LENGTH=69 /DNA_ID=CAMNT_0007517167 /DNA_START=614 /DNA_END=819 /DNA_ORIENTATION=+
MWGARLIEFCFQLGAACSRELDDGRDSSDATSDDDGSDNQPEYHCALLQVSTCLPSRVPCFAAAPAATP